MPQQLEQSRGGQRNELAAIDAIRAETVLSKLPIHTLSKKGHIEIHIERKNNKGEIYLSWRVTANREHGEPRQLAYNIDTLIINRRIHEVSKPVPEILCLGSLRGIEKELGLAPGNTSKIKKALLQNASVFLEAKLKYKDRKGVTQKFEMADTRYGLVVTGNELPDGTKADAIYIILHKPYRALLHSAQFRPLDYNYLKALTPASRRFYEVVSYPIFSTLKYKRPHAELLYSDYCMFSAQQRHYESGPFKKQVYKFYKPHLVSGYLSKVSYKAT